MATFSNLSNVDTPGYKRQDVAFEDVLRQALGKSTYRSMDAKVSGLDLRRLYPNTKLLNFPPIFSE